MNCPECGRRSSAGASLCTYCGAKLCVLCPYCSFPNPSKSNFCGSCGVKLHEDEPASKKLTDQHISRLQKYLPEGLTQKILSSRDKISGERRHVTMMFVDMKGFTAISDALGPEETFSLMDEFYEVLIQKVHTFQGTVMELRGDGILAFFGAPVACEDAPAKAIRAALAIQEGMTEFNETLSGEPKLPTLQLRIGINSGTVVVGTIGNEYRVQFTAVGDAINVAARMEQLAEPGAIYVTEATFRLTQGLFRFKDLGDKQLKGKRHPQKVYSVLGPKDAATRFDASKECGLSDFVGRQTEFRLLMEKFQEVKSGRGQVVSIVGAPGVGKSRLLHEFKNFLSKEEIRFLEAKAVSYSKNVAYHPVTELLKSAFSIAASDSQIESEIKIKKGLMFLGLDEADHFPYLSELLCRSGIGIDRIRMSKEALRDRILLSLQALAIKLSANKPLVIALEDLHWLDKSTEDAITSLLGHVSLTRLMVIFTYRPEFVYPSSWHASKDISLISLSNAETLSMVSSMLGNTNLSSNLKGLILAKTYGIPFYVEEFVRALKEIGLIVKTDSCLDLAENVNSVPIPSTIQEIIMVRVDSLSDGAKEVLQMASVVEREFSYELAACVTGFSEPELSSHLRVLVAKEFLYEQGSQPDATYLSRHALTQEVVYDSILRKHKIALHGKIGSAIESLYQTRLEEYYANLVDHFLISGDFHRSARYAQLAVDIFRKQAAIPSAISYSEKRTRALESLPRNREIQQEILESRMDYAMTLFMQGYIAKAREAIEPITSVVLSDGTENLKGQLLFILGAYQCAIAEDFDGAFESLGKAIQILEQTTDLMSAIVAYVFHGLALCWNCQFDNGANSIAKALWINEAAQVMWGISYMKSNLSYYSYNYKGDVQLGFETSLEALVVADRSGDILSRALAYICHGISSFYKGDFVTSRKLLLKGLDLCDKIRLDSFTPVGHQGLGHTYYELGAWQDAAAHHKAAVAIRERTGIFPSCSALNEIALARAILAGGRETANISALMNILQSNRSKLYRGIMMRYMAEIMLFSKSQDVANAENLLRQAIAYHEDLGMRWDLASDYLLLYRVMKVQSRSKESDNALKLSWEIFAECGSDGWCQKIESLKKRHV